jgi:hypothetical protein
VFLLLALGLTITDPAPRPQAAPTFRTGKTWASAAEQPSAPDCFPPAPPQPPAPGSPPAKITFEIDPPAPAAGELYELRVVFENEGAVALDIRSVGVTVRIDGKSVIAPLPALAKVAPPGEAVILLRVSEHWREVARWSFGVNVVATTAKWGVRYRNEVTWTASGAPDETDR